MNNFYMSINPKALIHNFEYFKNYRQKDILPVVKANAYGYGMNLIVDILYKHGVKFFAVARFLEALDILKENNKKDIKILVFENIDDLEFIKNSNNIIMSINSFNQLKEAIAFDIETEKMSLKIDLGYARNGISYQDREELKNIIKRNHFKFNGIHSHLFSSTTADGKKIIKQFKEIVDMCGRDNFKNIHLQNTASVFTHDIDYVTHLRMGVGLYGMQEPGYYDENLIRVGRLIGHIDSIKSINNIKYIAYENKNDLDISPDIFNIAKIKIGYGDGFLKENEGSTVLINHKEYKILQVTMDNTFIEVDENIKVGDKVELYYNFDTLKRQIGLNGYYLSTLLSSNRISRIIEE